MRMRSTIAEKLSLCLVADLALRPISASRPFGICLRMGTILFAAQYAYIDVPSTPCTRPEVSAPDFSLVVLRSDPFPVLEKQWPTSALIVQSTGVAISDLDPSVDRLLSSDVFPSGPGCGLLRSVCGQKSAKEARRHLC